MPRPKNVVSANVYPGAYGFRYTCRDSEGKVVYDSERAFRSRRAAEKDIKRSWPTARVSFEVR